MLKKIMLYLMTFETVGRLLLMTWLLSTGFGKLPSAVYLSVGVTIVAGIVMFCKNFFKPLKQKELCFYYLLQAGSVVFNLIFMKLYSRVEIGVSELLFIGTFIDLILCALFVLFTVRESNYVRVHVPSEQ